ncbi:MAG: type II toxin-antitoxin system HicA family toxin [Patescibacteria group bacterium]
MPKLKVLSGSDVIKILSVFGFAVVSQKGSHSKLARVRGSGREILTVPIHKELDTGTLRAVFRQASRFISESDLSEYFYTE